MSPPLSSPTAPVALILFNRADTLARVFAAVRAARPAHLFLIADGPRADRPHEAQLCAQARAVVADDEIDWPCTVIREFSDTNLGCKERVVSGINRLFQTHETAIILEDDCLPDASFFPYACELLERYRDNPDIMCIAGSRYDGMAPATGASYQIGAMPIIWGWATWRRAWAGYDPAIRSWAEDSHAQLGHLLDLVGAGRAPWRHLLRSRIESALDHVYHGKMNTWDYQFLYHVLKCRGKCIIPGKNLVINIGFDGRATHTDGRAKEADRVLGSLSFPLQHPGSLETDRALSQTLFRKNFMSADSSEPPIMHAIAQPPQKPRGLQKLKRKLARSLMKRLGYPPLAD